MVRLARRHGGVLQVTSYKLHVTSYEGTAGGRGEEGGEGGVEGGHKRDSEKGEEDVPAGERRVGEQEHHARDDL